MAVENVEKAVAQAYEEKGIRVVRLQGVEAADQELKGIQSLFRTVSDSISLHAYQGGSSSRENQNRTLPYAVGGSRLSAQTLTPFAFSEKQNRFVYGIGSVKTILERHGGQALVLLTGFDEISTSERRALVAAGILVKQLPLPVGVPGLPQAGKTSVSIAVIHSEGDILCYSTKGDSSTDLLNPAHAAGFVRNILSEFPEFKLKKEPR